MSGTRLHGENFAAPSTHINPSRPYIQAQPFPPSHDTLLDHTIEIISVKAMNVSRPRGLAILTMESVGKVASSFGVVKQVGFHIYTHSFAMVKNKNRNR